MGRLSLNRIVDLHSNALTEGINLEDWIAWALEPLPTSELRITSSKQTITIPALSEAPADLAVHVHRQILAHPARLSSLLAAVPTLGNDAPTLKALATPESELPQLQQHTQPSPLWMAWMETVQAERVREVWDRVRLGTEGAETPVKP